MTTVVYLHGFNSGPKSAKVEKIAKWCEENGHEFLAVEYNSYDGMGAFAKLQNQIRTLPHDDTVLVGTSLGGFWALYFSQLYGIKAMALNPTVDPFTTLRKYVNQTLKNFSTGEVFEFDDVDLSSFHPFLLSRVRLKNQAPSVVLVEEGDTELDHTKTEQELSGLLEFIKVPGGSHRFESMDLALQKLEELINTDVDF